MMKEVVRRAFEKFNNGVCGSRMPPEEEEIIYDFLHGLAQAERKKREPSRLTRILTWFGLAACAAMMIYFIFFLDHPKY